LLLDNRRCVADLDSAQFTTREKAAAEIGKLGESAGPGLREALKNRPSAEVRRRVLGLLEDSRIPSSPLRAVEVLEHLATPKARQLLTKVAQGLAEARLTREARASLDRLGKRGAAGPRHIHEDPR
jgi:hypothetical protein